MTTKAKKDKEKKPEKPYNTAEEMRLCCPSVSVCSNTFCNDGMRISWNVSGEC